MTNQGYSQPPIYQQTSTMAVISLISGIASFLGLILGWVNIGLALIGICLSILVFAGVLTLPFCFIPFANGFN